MKRGEPQSDLDGASADREEGQEGKDGAQGPRSARRSRDRRLRPLARRVGDVRAGAIWEGRRQQQHK
jgi:hypothetical protein